MQQVEIACIFFALNLSNVNWRQSMEFVRWVVSHNSTVIELWWFA